MMIVWGSVHYGKTDEVPGLFHVATRFGHLWFIPLIPLGSHLIFEPTSQGWRGLPIPLSGKSLFLGLLRPGSLIAAIVFGIAGLAAAGAPGPAGAPLHLATGAALLGVFLFFQYGKSFRFASYERAVALAEHAGLSAQGRVVLEAYFGKLSKEEAARLMQEAEQAAIAEAERAIAERKAAVDERRARLEPRES